MINMNNKDKNENNTKDKQKSHKLSSNEVNEILDRLKVEYPDAGCALDHRSVFELAVCVVLSAQTTDVSVNKVTPALFDKYPDAEALASADPEDVQKLIKTIGMYKTKAANIIKMSKRLCEEYGGEVPEDYDKLISLPGVGRKTANVILAEGFGHQRIAVDTHVFRVSRMIGLAGAAEWEKAADDEASVALNGKICQSGKGDTGVKCGSADVHRSTGKRTDIPVEAVSIINTPTTLINTSAKTAGTKEVMKTEQELMAVLPEGRWTEAHHSLIFHGRRCCRARNPECSRCVIADLCRYNTFMLKESNEAGN